MLTWVTLALSSGAAASLVAAVPQDWQWIRLVLTFATATVSLYSLVQQNQKRVTDCADLHVRWSRVANDYQALWDATYEDAAQEQFLALRERAVELSKSGLGIPFGPNLMLKWQTHVMMHHHLQAAA